MSMLTIVDTITTIITTTGYILRLLLLKSVLLQGIQLADVAAASAMLQC